MVLEYNRSKKGIDIADQLASYNTLVRKTCIWYKKIAADLISIAVINAILIYKDVNTNNKLSLLKGYEMIIKHLVEVQEPGPSRGKSVAPSSSLSCSSRTSSPASINRGSTTAGLHKLIKLERQLNGIIYRRRCSSCYKKLKDEGQSVADARIESKRLIQNAIFAKNLYLLYDIHA